MKEDDDPKSSLQPTRLEVPRPKPTHVVASEPQLTEKKKKKKLNKGYLSGSSTASQPNTQDEVVVNIGGSSTEVCPSVFPTPMGNVVSEMKYSNDPFT